LEQRKAKRGGRILVDVMRNAYAHTAVAPYSVRARPEPTVAVPLEWNELARARPDGGTIAAEVRRGPEPGRPGARGGAGAGARAARVAWRVRGAAGRSPPRCSSPEWSRRSAPGRRTFAATRRERRLAARAPVSVQFAGMVTANCTRPPHGEGRRARRARQPVT